MLVLKEIRFAFRAGTRVVIVLRQGGRRKGKSNEDQERQSDDGPSGAGRGEQTSLPEGTAPGFAR
jgi:hypothetical protein